MTEKTLSLDDIYLDPNNPRFMRDEVIDESRVKEKAVQDQLLEKMSAYDTDVLKENIRENGFLRIDRVVVKPLPGGGYVVLEGNRRIAALKMLMKEHTLEGRTIPKEKLQTIQSVEALVYEGKDPEASWFYQGLRSIAGIKDWTPYQKAKFIAERKARTGASFGQIAKTLGISGTRVTRWYRSYRAFEQLHLNEEYGDMLKTDMFAYLTDGVFYSGCTGLKTWLGWNDSKEVFDNEQNVTSFLSWLFPSEDGVPARISRAQDLRDWVCYWASDDPEFFAVFTNSTLSVDQAREVKLKKKQEQEAEKVLTNQTLDEFLASISELANKLPKLPMVEAFDRKADVQAAYQKIRTEVDKVLKILGSDKG